MFALEISFNDGVSQPETIFVRRPQALIGASDLAHVVIEDMRNLKYQLRVVRDLGKRFKVKPVLDDASASTPLIDGIYEVEADFDLGSVKLHITALDSDLLVKETEAPDRAGVRIMRQASANPGPVFPAVAVLGSNSMVVSFSPEQPVYVGRSKQCGVRLDSAEISAQHCRVGYESGEFWVEDLGSTNGTFINQQQISGRATLPSGASVVLGREIALVGVTTIDQVQRLNNMFPATVKKSPAQERKYPVLVSVSEVARPARLVIPHGAVLKLGRDPSSDIWLGAPHVSRMHSTIAMTKTGAITLTDTSTNGTGYDDGILMRGQAVELDDDPKVLDFGGGVTVAICFDEEQEKAFVLSQGSPHIFRKGEEQKPDKGQSLRERRDTLSSAALDVGPLRQVQGADFKSRIVATYRSLGVRGRVLFVIMLIAAASVLVILLTLAIPFFH